VAWSTQAFTRRGVRATLSGWRDNLRAAVRAPGPERTAALLLVKAAVASVIAWQLAVRLMDSPTPFYAPLAAQLVVDETIVRSIWQSIERVAAVVLGMSVAWVVGSCVGVTWWSMVPVMLLALLIGRWDRLGDHGIQVPVMVLLSLLTVKWDDVDFTYLTIVETVLGGAVGIAVNAVVLAPMHLTGPRRAVRDLTDLVQGLLEDMATGLREGWDGDTARLARPRHPDRRGGARGPRRHREGPGGTRLNPRHRLRPARVDWEGYKNTAETVQRGQWPVAGIARTLADAADDAQWLPSPSPAWLAGYADVLEAHRVVEELRGQSGQASVPTDTGPIRMPIAESLPTVGALQRQVPAAARRRFPRPRRARRADPGRESEPRARTSRT
jgi:hypothetical protein